MKKYLFLFVLFFVVKASHAADTVVGGNLQGDGGSAHTSLAKTDGFAPRTGDPEVEKARSQFRFELVQRYCELSFWKGEGVAHTQCDTTLLAQAKKAKTNQEILDLINKYKEIDFTSRTNKSTADANADSLQFMYITNQFFQSYAAKLEQGESVRAIKDIREDFYKNYFAVTKTESLLPLIPEDTKKNWTKEQAASLDLVIPEDAKKRLVKEEAAMSHLSDEDHTAAQKEIATRDRNDLEKARDQVRLHMMARLCQIDLFVGHDMGTTSCKIAMVKNDHDGEKNADGSTVVPDHVKIMDDLTQILTKDEYKNDPAVKRFFEGDQVKVQELRAAGRSSEITPYDYGFVQEMQMYLGTLERAKSTQAMSVLNQGFHDYVFKTLAAMGNAVPAEARAIIAQNEGASPSLTRNPAAPIPAPVAPIATPAAKPAPVDKDKEEARKRLLQIFDE